MAPHITSLSRSIRYAFDGADCLYRGFDGQRVVVDFEGSGTAVIHRADCPLTFVRSGKPLNEFRQVFQDTFTLYAEQPGLVVADVFSHIPDGLLGRDSARFQGSFEGAGWLVGGHGRCNIDGRHDVIALDEPYRPIPVFSSVVGAGEFDVVPDFETRTVLADAWDVSDSEALSERGWKVQNMSRLRDLDSRYEDGTSHVAQVASHLNAATWISPIPETNRGVFLRKYFDRFHGRQRARVHVDGEFVGVWYEPRENRIDRWAISDFGLPASATAGKGQISITIDPPSGVSLWSISRVEVWALLGGD